MWQGARIRCIIDASPHMPSVRNGNASVRLQVSDENEHAEAVVMVSCSCWHDGLRIEEP